MVKEQEVRERDSLENVVNLKQTLYIATKNGVMKSLFLLVMWGNTQWVGEILL